MKFLLSAYLFIFLSLPASIYYYFAHQEVPGIGHAPDIFLFGSIFAIVPFMAWCIILFFIRRRISSQLYRAQVIALGVIAAVTLLCSIYYLSW